MEIDKELIDKLLADYKGPEDLIGEQGLLKQLTKALVERAMNAELTHHLGYEKHAALGPAATGNSRNGREPQEAEGRLGRRRRSRCRAIPTHFYTADRAASTSGASPGSTTRFCRCMRGA